MKWFASLLVILLVSACSAPADEAYEVRDHEPEYPEVVPAPTPPPVMAPRRAQLERYEGFPAVRNSPERGDRTVLRHPEPDPQITPGIVIDQLEEASFAYTVPWKVNIDETFDVQLLVNPAKSVAEVVEELEGEGHGGQLLISQIVRAELVSDDFEVMPLTPAAQGVDGVFSTEWRWQLTPRSPGKDKRVRISVSALVTVDGEKVERYIDTYDGVIYVDVTNQQRITKWFEENWKWFFSAILVPLLGWLALKIRRKLKGEPGDTE